MKPADILPLLHWRRLLILPVLAIALAGCSIPPKQQSAPGSLTQVQILPEASHIPAALDGPVITWSERFAKPRENVVYFLKVDLTDRRVEAFVQLSEDPDGPTGPAEGVLTLPEELMAKGKETLAMVNANAFSPVPPEKAPDWHRGWPVNIEGLAVGDHILRSPDDSQRVAFWLDAGGRPHIGHPAPSDTVRQAVADWISPLLINGQNVCRVDRTEAKIHPRSLLGFDDTSRWLLLVVVDGRQKGYSIGMTLGEAAELMRAKGCTQAINLDGGGSSILLVRDAAGKILTRNRPSGGKHRPVPVMIGVRQTPSKSEPSIR